MEATVSNTVERSDKRTVYDYSVWVRGVFGRNRTVKFATFTVARREADARLTDEEAIALMRAKVSEIRLKAGSLMGVDERPVELDGPWAKFVLFSERSIAKEVL